MSVQINPELSRLSWSRTEYDTSRYYLTFQEYWRVIGSCLETESLLEGRFFCTEPLKTIMSVAAHSNKKSLNRNSIDKCYHMYRDPGFEFLGLSLSFPKP